MKYILLLLAIVAIIAVYFFVVKKQNPIEAITSGSAIDPISDSDI